MGLNVGGSPHLAGAFGDWFPLSLLLLGLAALIWILAGWLAPWRYRVGQQERERELARALVHAWGVDTLAPFVLRVDKSYFFNESESAFLAYRVVGGVAIVSGDPIGPHDEPADLVAALRRARPRARLARRDPRRVGGVLADLRAARSPRAVPRRRSRPRHVARSRSRAGAIRKVRQSVHRLEHAGYTARALRPSELDDRRARELETSRARGVATRPSAAL